MDVTPELAISDLQNCIQANGVHLTPRALEVFTEFEQRCFRFDIVPFYEEILAPLIKLVPQFTHIITKYGGDLERGLVELDQETSRRTGNDDPYAIGTLYSYCDHNNIFPRTILVEQCIKRVKCESRKEITTRDIILALLDSHDEIDPPYDNARWSDERLHTPYNTLCHLVGVYKESLWIKFEDIRKEFGSLYDLAISFAGEDRDIARAIAQDISSFGFKAFYDEYEKASLWGKDLYSHFTEVYSSKARHCLMIVSKYYKSKVWTNLERQAAQARALQEHKEYILPLRIDDTDISGLLPTIGYIDFRTTSIEEIADLIRIKLLDVTSNPHVV